MASSKLEDTIAVRILALGKTYADELAWRDTTINDWLNKPMFWTKNDFGRQIKEREQRTTGEKDNKWSE